MGKGEGSRKWCALLSRIGAQLRQQAIRYRWVVLTTNQVRGVPMAARAVALPARLQPHKRSPQSLFGKDEVRREVTWVPALGIRWMVTPHVRVVLQKLNHTNKDEEERAPNSNATRIFTLLSSPLAAPAQVGFKITENGIEASE
ncbi:unnamed protein product [Phytomonas sp. Hart1]|nr:unnamed protein product [Phytomonas sp. Hart1]|eukprot:CCW67447.1 unnamed protein product [Phytomonas sp. isolate Hart1]